ncbi:chondroadherin [Lutzomyia longipalpis]|uniref:chondroadherin n=1 Tax=Lutzomyia longipalpis TaxID=7200 RepID=UPI002483F96B|nr:chondroadherin [Lutzomyia longipalpis]
MICSWWLLICCFCTIEILWTWQSVVVACPAECICLSQTQVLCNTGGLREIPARLLPVTVENLALTKNHFPVIKSDAFGGLRALKKLSLDGNNITTIKPFAFRGLPRLRELSIQHTPLATVAQFAFAGLQNITTILLSHNKILRVEGFAFAGTSNVRLILLSNNPMLKIDTSAFSGLSNVEHLILPSGIRSVEPDAFVGLDTVGLLKLAYMDLTSLQPFTFRGLTNIQVLSLQESDLGVICANAFDGLTHVGTLNILNNKIDSIQELNITAAHFIRQIKLQGNHLLETPDPETMIIEGVENLIVVNNHFPCGCHIHTLLETPLANGTHSGSDFLSKNFCISPLEVNGRPMSDLDLYAIGRCQEQVTRENLEASSGRTINFYTVLCSLLATLYLSVTTWMGS